MKLSPCIGWAGQKLYKINQENIPQMPEKWMLSTQHIITDMYCTDYSETTLDSCADRKDMGGLVPTIQDHVNESTYK